MAIDAASTSTSSRAEYMREYMRQYRAAHREKTNAQRRASNAANRVAIAERRRGYSAANKEKISLRNKAYIAANREKIAEQKRAYNADNRARRAAKNRARYAADPQFRIGTAIRARMRRALRGQLKTGSAIGLLGCSVAEAVAHLERQFAPGMSWANHGAWQIDHILPFDAFDLTDAAQLAQVCHYSNLQPLWALENRLKSNKLISGAPPCR